MGQQTQILSQFPEFDFARKRVNQQRIKAEQDQTDALKRAFVRGPGLRSGAFIKNVQLLQERLDEQERTANEQIDLAEFAERRKQQEVKEGREFVSGEAVKQREFAGEQAGIQREFAGEQAGIGRTFASGEAVKQRGFAGEQAGIQRTFASTEAGKQRTFQGEISQKQLDLQEKQLAQDKIFKQQQMDLFQKQLDLDTLNSEFNRAIAQALSDKPTDLLGSLFGPGFSTSPGGGLSILGDITGSIFKGIESIF